MVWVKASDEGSSSPFMARLFIGLLNFRDQLFLLSADEAIRQQLMSDFDSKYKPLFEAARSTRDAGRDLLLTLSNYLESIDRGETIKIIDGQIQILKTI